MPQAPADHQRRLLDVQDADLRLQQARHKRAHLPVLADIAQLEDRTLDLSDDVVTRRAEVSDLRREVQKAEDDVQAVRARAERDTQRLNAGQGGSKELQALQSELELLARRQSDLEDVELEAMERLETAQANLDDAERQASAIRTDLETRAQERDAAFAEIDEQIADLDAERAAAARDLDPALMSLYERLREQQGGVGAAALRGNQCLGCHMSLNPADLRRIETAAADDVVRCEECGRILVRKADA